MLHILGLPLPAAGTGPFWVLGILRNTPHPSSSTFPAFSASYCQCGLGALCSGSWKETRLGWSSDIWTVNVRVSWCLPMFCYCSEHFIYVSIEGILCARHFWMMLFFIYPMLLLSCVKYYFNCFQSFIQKELTKCLLCVQRICSIINLVAWQWAFTESFLCVIHRFRIRR